MEEFLKSYAKFCLDHFDEKYEIAGRKKRKIRNKWKKVKKIRRWWKNFGCGEKYEKYGRKFVVDKYEDAGRI